MMSKIVRTISDQLILFIMVFGFYIITHGHLTPGGGFQGGAVIASGVVMMIAAFGSNQIKKSLKEHHLSVVESSGALIFLGMALAGLGTTFFFNFLVGTPVFGTVPSTGPNTGNLWTGGVIPLMNLGVGLKVMAGLSAVVLAMALFSSGEEMEE